MSDSRIESGEPKNRRKAMDGMTRRLVDGGMSRGEARDKARECARRRDIHEAEGRMKRKK